MFDRVLHPLPRAPRWASEQLANASTARLRRRVSQRVTRTEPWPEAATVVSRTNATTENRPKPGSYVTEKQRYRTIKTSQEYQETDIDSYPETMAPTQHLPGNEVPIFLRKTYHMIDSCDKSIAGWCEEDGGKTFVVKEPTKFEQQIIPQFFKHNKFASFVRQLNFYSFRKIKYSNSIRIDYETEKRTANYWRFRHEHFQQGRPDLLVHIKRTNGKGSNSNTNPAAVAATAAKQPDVVVSAAVATSNSAPVGTAVVDKSEVQSLKQRIDEMSKNMDALTEMVQKVSLQQQETEGPGMKRKKLSVEEQASSSSSLEVPLPDGALSASASPTMMDLDDMPLPEGVGSIQFPPAALPLGEESRESSIDSNEFVDQLFSAFQEDEGLLGPMMDGAEDQITMTDDSAASSSDNNGNRPDPELMKRLSDALEMLPKETQEMIVNRLIAAITSTDFLAAKVPTSDPKKVAVSGKALPKMEDEPQPQLQPQQPTALAAATFAALMQHYTNQIKENNSRSKSEAASSANKKQLQKTIPVIPVHA